MSPSKPKAKTKPAAKQPSPEAQLRALIAKYAPEDARLIGTVRRTLRKRLPTATEIVYDYGRFFVVSFSPTEYGYQGVFAIRGSSDGVKLYFTGGKDLPDPEKLLSGSAQARAIEVEGASTLTRPAVVRLIGAALARNKVPFARTGGGAVIMSPSTAKKGKKRA